MRFYRFMVLCFVVACCVGFEGAGSWLGIVSGSWIVATIVHANVKK